MGSQKKGGPGARDLGYRVRVKSMLSRRLTVRCAMLVKTVGSNRFRRGIESDRDLRAGFFLFCWPSSRLLEIVVDQFRWTHERCGRASLPSCARYHCVAINHSCEAVTPPMGGVSVPPHRSPRVLDKSKNSARISQRRIPRKKKKA